MGLDVLPHSSGVSNAPDSIVHLSITDVGVNNARRCCRCTGGRDGTNDQLLAKQNLMSFALGNLPETQARLENWWAYGEQKYPCLKAVQLGDEDAGLPETDDLRRWWADVDFVIKRQMTLMENQEYLGTAVPYHYVNLGASAMAAVLGAEMKYVNRNTIWAHPTLTALDEVLDVRLDRGNYFYQMVGEITRRSAALAKDHHFVTLFALGGAADSAAGLYGSENLLRDMIQNPQSVARALATMTELWLEALDETSGLIAESGNAGMVGWTGVWAPGTTFPMQEDFSYMIGSEMFERLCLPQIRRMADALEYPMYHLDGRGAVKHVDSLLKVDRLKAIQWEPGAGGGDIKQWYDLIKHILSHQRSVQVSARAEEVDDLIENVGPRGLLIGIADPGTEKAARLFDRYASQ